MAERPGVSGLDDYTMATRFGRADRRAQMARCGADVVEDPTEGMIAAGRIKVTRPDNAGQGTDSARTLPSAQSTQTGIQR